MIHWTPAARKKARPGRRGDPPRSARKPHNLDKALHKALDKARQAVAALYAERGPRWADGESQAQGEHRQWMEAVRTTFAASEWPTASPEVEGARAFMLADHDEEKEEKKGVVPDALVPLWIAARGPSFALASLARATSLKRIWHPQRGKPAGWYLAPEPSASRAKLGALDGWGAVRVELGRTDARTYDDTRLQAAEARRSAPLLERCAISFAFPAEIAWARADLDACLAEGEFPGFGVMLLGSGDVEVAVRAAGACSLWDVEAYLYTMLDALDDEAVRPLAVLFDRADPEWHLGTVARALALIESDAAADVFVRGLAQPKIRKIAETYLLGAPLLAVRAFARAFTERAPSAAPPWTQAAAALYARLRSEASAPVTEALTPMPMAASEANFVPALTLPPWLTSIVPWPAPPIVIR